MKAPHEVNAYDHVIIYIWGSSGGGGRGVGHVAANLHQSNFSPDTFVSLWPGYESNKPLTWQKDFQEVFKKEHYHAPTTVLVFYTMDILSMIGRFNTLQLLTETWVRNPTKEESLDLESRRHNCCTAVWNVLKAGKICGDKGILSESEFQSVLSAAKIELSQKGASQFPHSTGQFFKASSQSQNSRTTSMVASGPSTLTWEALLSGERYGPEMLYEILTKAKKKEVEKMVATDPDDVRLTLRFGGPTGLKDEKGYFIRENYVGVETEAFSTPTIKNALPPRPL